MIKTPEDLIGYYVDPNDSEVYERFMDFCEEHGIKWGGGDKAKDYFPPFDFDYVRLKKSMTLCYGEMKELPRPKTFIKLTLSDFDPQQSMVEAIEEAGFYDEPPIGLMPKDIHQENRVADILAAMTRYTKAGKKVPYAWLDELDSLRNAFCE